MFTFQDDFMIHHNKSLYDYDVYPDYYVHCVSADFITLNKEEEKFFGTKKALKEMCPNPKVGTAILTNYELFHLVVKEHCNDKPTYEALTSALVDLREQLSTYNGSSLLATTELECGENKLDLNKVYNIIEKVFNDTKIHVEMYLNDD